MPSRLLGHKGIGALRLVGRVVELLFLGGKHHGLQISRALNHLVEQVFCKEEEEEEVSVRATRVRCSKKRWWFFVCGENKMTKPTHTRRKRGVTPRTQGKKQSGGEESICHCYLRTVLPASKCCSTHRSSPASMDHDKPCTHHGAARKHNPSNTKPLMNDPDWISATGHREFHYFLDTSARSRKSRGM